MRIAVYHNLPPGGALRVLYDFVRRAAGEHEFDLYTVDLGRFDHFAYASDRAEPQDLTPWVAHSYRYPVVPAAIARVLPASAWSMSASTWMHRVHRRIATDINARGYDVALVNSCSITHTPSVLRRLRVPSLHYMQEPRRRTFEADYQEPDAGMPLPRRAAAALRERFLRRDDRAAAMAADRIACNSYYSAESIQRAYGRGAVVSYLGVDTDVFDLGEEAHSANEAASVLSVGALDRTKGHDLIVRAVALLPTTDRPAIDLVYERVDPEYRAELDALAGDLGVRLRFHTGISDDDLVRLYRSAAVTVVAARLEPFGLVPLESIACGTPVVAVREGGLPGDGRGRRERFSGRPLARRDSQCGHASCSPTGSDGAPASSVTRSCPSGGARPLRSVWWSCLNLTAEDFVGDDGPARASDDDGYFAP